MQLAGFLESKPGRGELARARLLLAALQVFGEKGLKGATVRDIASRARQNVAAIKYYFGSKEDLYQAVVQGIIRELRHRLGDRISELAAIRQRGRPDPAEALRFLKLFLRTMYLRLLSREEVMDLGRVIIREQTQPSASFQILYEGAFRELHEGLCFLVGTVLGTNPRDCQTIIRTHSLMGQVWFFAIARETVLRRLGWTTLGGEHGEVVATILEQNIEALLRGLSRKIRRPSALARQRL